MRKMPPFVWSALLLGAVVNLAAGARRPLVERHILAGNHAHAEAVRRLVPPEEMLALVVYDRDMIDELDVSIWFDHRSRWLLHPRNVALTHIDPERQRRPG